MEYIIARAPKEKCPPEVRGFWNLDLIPTELWETYERAELPEEGRSLSFIEAMEEKVGYLSDTYPLYFWKWFTIWK